MFSPEGNRLPFRLDDPACDGFRGTEGVGLTWRNPHAPDFDPPQRLLEVEPFPPLALVPDFAQHSSGLKMLWVESYRPTQEFGYMPGQAMRPGPQSQAEGGVGLRTGTKAQGTFLVFLKQAPAGNDRLNLRAGNADSSEGHLHDDLAPLFTGDSQEDVAIGQQYLIGICRRRKPRAQNPDDHILHGSSVQISNSQNHRTPPREGESSKRDRKSTR